MDAESYTSWELANLAKVTSPDAHDGIGFSADQDVMVHVAGGSPGARFLRSIAYDVSALIEDGLSTRDDDHHDALHDLADSAVPIYTHEMWSTFVDLAAYTEDVSELSAEDTSMNRQAAIALYMIAERLAFALIEAEKAEDEGDEDDA